MNGPRDPFDRPNGRSEPTLGNLDHLDRPAASPAPDDGLPRMQMDADPRRSGGGGRRPAPPRTSGGKPWLWPVLVVILAIIAAGLYFNQDKLSGLLPRTDYDDVLHRAQAALQAGHLDGSDGTSARELFEAARALQPDNDAARQGLNDVGRAEIGRADAAVQAGHMDEAAQALEQARELLGGGADVDRLSQIIAKAQVSSGETGQLIQQAQQALSDNKPDVAADLYKRVLAADPDNAVARHGMDQVGDAMAAQIQQQLSRNDVAGASAGIDKLAALQPNHSQLPALRAALSTQQAQASSQLNDAISQGNDALRAGRVLGEGDDTALAHFKAALAIDPNNAQAKAGLGQVAEALIVQANAALDSGDSDHAHQLLDQAAQLAPGSADLVAARARLDHHAAAPAAAGNPPAQAVAQDDTDTTPPAQLTPQQQAQVADMVHRAHQATLSGNIMDPPGDCAYDLYRGALAIDGNNAAALSGLQGLPGEVQKQFNDALSNGSLARAGHLLDALGNLSPGDAGLGQMRQRLVDAWTDQAGQQLDSGDRNNAAQSLEQARHLAPNDPRVQQLSTRMQGG